jgi:hypothetical protein
VVDEREALQAFVDSLDKWAIVCGLFVALGVVGESVVGYLHWTKGNRLHILEESARLEQQAVVETARAHAEEASLKVADATKDIETARKEAAEANARAAEANKIAEGERLARVKIEERLAPRRLTPEQAAAISKTLAPLAAGGQRVAFIGQPDFEPAVVGKALVDILRAAGWRVTDVWGHDTSRATAGIVVEVAAGADATDRDSAAAFATAMRSIANFNVVGPEPMEERVLSGSFLGNNDPRDPPMKDIGELAQRVAAATIKITVGSK